MKRSLLLIVLCLILVSLVSISCDQKPKQDINEIRVATNATHPPFTYLDEKTNEPIGFDIDLIKAIAKKEALDIDIVDVRFEALLDGMAKGQYDAAVGAISITENRKKDMLFSESYFVAGHVVTVRTDNTSITGKDSLPGKVVGVQAGTTSAVDVSGMNNVTMKSYAEYGLVFQALMDGNIDAVISDDTVALNYINKNPDKLKLAGTPFTQENYGIAVNKSNPELLAKINSGLKAVKSEGLIEELSKKWLPPSSDLNDTIIRLERTACYGKCPVYTLTINGNGTVVYEGKDFVQTKGTKETTISEEKLQQLVSEFEKINYFSLNDSYVQQVITDASSAITSITVSGKTKTITHYQGDLNAPKPLKELENKIDEIVNSAQWIK